MSNPIFYSTTTPNQNSSAPIILPPPLIIPSLSPLSPIPDSYTLLQSSSIPNPHNTKKQTLFLYTQKQLAQSFSNSNQTFSCEPLITLQYASKYLKKTEDTTILVPSPNPSNTSSNITAYQLKKGALASITSFSISHHSTPTFISDLSQIIDRLRLQNPQSPLLWPGPLPLPALPNVSTISDFWSDPPAFSFNTSTFASSRKLLATPLLILLLSACTYLGSLTYPYLQYSDAATTLQNQSKSLQGVYQFNSERLSSLKTLQEFLIATQHNQTTSLSSLHTIQNLISTIHSTPQTLLQQTNINRQPQVISVSSLTSNSSNPDKNPLASSLRKQTSFLITINLTLGPTLNTATTTAPTLPSSLTPPNASNTSATITPSPTSSPNNPQSTLTTQIRPLILYWAQTTGLSLYAAPQIKTNPSSQANPSQSSISVSLLGSYDTPTDTPSSPVITSPTLQKITRP